MHNIPDEEFSFSDVRPESGKSASPSGKAATSSDAPEVASGEEPASTEATPAAGEDGAAPSSPDAAAPDTAAPDTAAPDTAAPVQGAPEPEPAVAAGDPAAAERASTPVRKRPQVGTPDYEGPDRRAALPFAVRPGPERRRMRPAVADVDGPAAALPTEPVPTGTKKPSVELSNERVNPRHQLQKWLAAMTDSSASDLILRAGGRPSLRIDSKISFLPGRVPGPGPLSEVLRGILGEKRMAVWTETGSADAALDLDGLGRFRINAYKQMGEPAIVIRRLNERAPSLDDLNLPADDLKEFALKRRGLALVTGVAGSGKSTTLAAMIEFMNRTVERHIVTLEDPVELLFRERYCVISQREVGTDTTSFKEGLKHALRQSPDVILIGEMRDAETVIAALEAVETGHLVMSTMHTVNAAQTVDRILGFFPAERHVQIRQRMADNLAGVLSMRLVPRIGGGLVPAFELMHTTPHIRELLEEGLTTELGKVIEAGNEPGLVSFNERLRELVETGMVTLEDALGTSDRPDELLLALRGIRGGSERSAASSGQKSSAGPPKRRLSDPGGGEEGRNLRPDDGSSPNLRLRGDGAA